MIGYVIHISEGGLAKLKVAAPLPLQPRSGNKKSGLGEHLASNMLCKPRGEFMKTMWLHPYYYYYALALGMNNVAGCTQAMQAPSVK